MSYADTLATLADSADADARKLYARYESGELSASDFAALLVALVNVRRGRAASLALLGLAATLSADLKRLTPVSAQVSDDAAKRLQTAVQSLLAAIAATPDPSGRVARLARSETLAAAHEAWGDALADQPDVNGWIRQPEADACQLCTWWADDEIRPTNARMATHNGCQCIQRPITETP